MAIRQKIRLGDVLLKAGVVSPEQLQQALDAQKLSGIALGKALIDMNILTEEKLATSLSQQLNVPFVDFMETRVDPAALKKVKENVARLHKLIPIKIQDGKLQVAMSNPLNVLAIDEVVIQSGMDVDVVIATESDIVHAIQENYGVAASIQAAVKSLGEADARREQFRSTAQASKGPATLEASEAPVARLVEMVLKQALEDKASDIHIEPSEDLLNIRYRIDGVLFETSKPPKSVESALISRIKVLANMDIAETRAPQDGGFSAKLDGKDIEFRVSTCPTIYGENLVLRILDRSKLMFRLPELGLIGDDLQRFTSLLHKPYGVILVTGPTGSGKTTTLYACLHILNTPDKNIKTIEDPVEYRLPGIRQTQVNPKANVTFANGLRSLMRQDPDIIMVGEIRDLETSEIAIQAALTGHLVFSTLHTNDAPGALSRLADLGIEPFLMASSVIGILAQRLVRNICKLCKAPYQPTEEELAFLFPKGDRQPLNMARGAGCKACKKSGYSGRLGIFEILCIMDDIRELIMKKAAPNIIREVARKTQDMKTLRADGLFKVRNGYTTLDELNRVTFVEESMS
jgi:type IV pilus assembly protein PilB